MDDKAFKRSLGRNIRLKRKKLGFSQEKLAEYVDLNEKHIGQIELGNKLPNSLTLFKLCSELEIEPNHLFDEIKKEMKK